MMDFSFLDKRPILLAIAGPNGAGKSTFYHTHLKRSGLEFLNADVVAKEHNIDSYKAADYVKVLREKYVNDKRSFIFETVFSDPVGDKLSFLKDAAEQGYEVCLCFIGLTSWKISEQRVSIRVRQGGHDVPTEKLEQRFPRTLNNLKQAIPLLPHVLVYDNSEFFSKRNNESSAYRELAQFRNGEQTFLANNLPQWFQDVLN